tara:strand:- start:34 stop:267 length:234 start_codon:yes stop_codon:yes gene_type:complete
MTGYLEELRVRAKQYGMTDVPERLDCIVEAVIYGSALAAYAREEIDLIWLEVEAEEEAYLEPPTEEELKLIHPFFDV